MVWAKNQNLILFISTSKGWGALVWYKEEKNSPLTENVHQHSEQSLVKYIREESCSQEAQSFYWKLRQSASAIKSPPSLFFSRLSYPSEPFRILLDRQKPDFSRAAPDPNESACSRSRFSPSLWPSFPHSRFRSRLETRNAAPNVKPTDSSSTPPCRNSSRPNASVNPRTWIGPTMAARYLCWMAPVSISWAIFRPGSISWTVASGTISDTAITEGRTGAMKTTEGRLTRFSRRICRMSVISVTGFSKVMRRPHVTPWLWRIIR